MIFIRYSLTGGAATAVHYLILLGLVELFGLKPWLATAVGALCGAAVAYLGNRYITFNSNFNKNSFDKKSPQPKHTTTLPRFLMVATLGAGLNSLLVFSISHSFSLHYFAAQVIATIIVLVLTFHLNRLWTFA